MKTKKATKSALDKLQKFRKRWGGHEGIETAHAHLFVGPSKNGVQKRPSRRGNTKRGN